ncbi:MAG: hypothetical protein WA705_01145 [Candidatus Ozemobacteraceae bacterium]
MKSDFPVIKTRASGFTLVEMAVGAFVLGLLVLVSTMLFRQSVTSFRMTSWKQERLQEVQLFWNYLRKNLEEASDAIDIGGDVNISPRPLLHRSVPSTAGALDGPVLRWMRSRMGASGIPEYRVECQVLLKSRSISLQISPSPGFTPPAEELIPLPKRLLTDVTGFVIQTTAIRLDPVRGEYLGSGGAPIVGSLVEISIRFSPSPDSGLPNQLEITQNHKFKLTVDATPLANPADFPPFL